MNERRARGRVLRDAICIVVGIIACLFFVALYTHWQIVRERPMFCDRVDRPFVPFLSTPWVPRFVLPTADGHSLLVDEELNLAVILIDPVYRSPGRHVGRHETAFDVVYNGKIQRVIIARQRDRAFVIRSDGTHVTYVLGEGQAQLMHDRTHEYLATERGGRTLLEIAREVNAEQSLIDEIAGWERQTTNDD